MIPLSIPVIGGNEWKYVKECLDTGWVSSVGSYVERFEAVLKEHTGTRFSVATVNGTSALHLSLIAAGVEPSDAVIVPTLTFIAPVNAVRYCGALPIFMDSDPATLGLDVSKFHAFLNDECTLDPDGVPIHRTSGRRIKAMIPVHVFGHPVDMDPLLELARTHHLTVIEDATESVGSEYKGRRTGSLGDLGCFSFNGNKVITTGGGGMITTNREDWAARMKHLSTQAKADPFEYDHDEVGYNYRLTNIQAAMGVAQMEQLEGFLATKRRNATLYREIFSELPELDFLWEQPWAKSNFWFYALRIPSGMRRGLLESLNADKIQARPVWRPIHTLTMYRDCPSYRIEEAPKIYETLINLPCSANLREDEVRAVAGKVKAFLARQKELVGS